MSLVADNTASEVKSPTIRIYAAGGCGTNVTHHYNQAKEVAGFANLDIAYIDTSRSNLKPDINPDKVFIISGQKGQELDGSGSIRRDNAAHISASVKQILLKFKPSTFNIVIFSGAGGSGSVIAPEIISELAANNHPVLAIMVGSNESEIHADNTVKTLKSLEAISNNRKYPISLFYAQNPTGKPRSEADDLARYAIATLSVLFSRSFHGLDTRDLENWLNYTKVGGAPQLSLLQIHRETADVDKVQEIISVASLFTDPNQPSFTTRPRYVCKGYGRIPFEGRDTLHFTISGNAVASVYNEVHDDTSKLKEELSAQVNRTSLVEKGDTVTESGLVF